MSGIPTPSPTPTPTPRLLLLALDVGCEDCDTCVVAVELVVLDSVADALVGDIVLEDTEVVFEGGGAANLMGGSVNKSEQFLQLQPVKP
jgi:hypothetical protein